MTPAKRIPWFWLASLAVILLASVFLHPEQYGGKIYSSGDAKAAEAFKVVGDRMLEEGVYPLWNPYVFLGMPSYASLAYTPGAYPLERPVDRLTKALGLPPMTWLLLHVLLLGLGTAGYLRWRGLSWAASIGGGVAVMALPKFVAWCAYGHGTKVMSLAWMPWILWMIEGLLRRGRWPWALGLALTLGAALLRAHVQIVYYTAMAGFLWFCFLGLARWREPGGRKRVLRRTGMLAVALGLALGLAMALFLPVFSYQAHSVRGAASTGGGVDYSYATGWSLSLAEIPTFWWSTAAGYGKLSYVGGMPFTDYPQYLGLPLLLFAFLGFVFRRDRWAWMLLTLALLATLVSLGRNGPVYRLFYELLPGFNKFRVPVMILILQGYAVVLLAAAGMDELSVRLAPPRRPSWLLPLVVAPVVVGGGVLLVLGTVASGVLTQESIRHWLSMRPGVPLDALDAAAKLARHDALRLGVLLLAAIGAGALHRRGRLPRTVLLALWGGLIFVDLWAVDQPITHPERHLKAATRDARGKLVSVWAPPVIQPLSVARSYVASNGALDFLARQGSFPRVWPLGSLAQENSYGPQGVVSLGGYHAAKLRIYQSLLERLYPGRGLVDLATVKLLAAGWVHVPSALNEATLKAFARRGMELEAAYEGDGGAVYRIVDAGPRCWLVDSFELEKPGRDTTGEEPAPEVLRRTLDRNLALDRVAILSAPPHPAPTRGEGSIERVEEEPQRIVFESNADHAAIAVFADIYYPDWKVTVDGAPAKLLRADYALRAVAVAPGRHRIEFIYHDGAFIAGRWIQRVSFLLILLGLGWVVYNRTRRKPSTAPGGSEE